MVSFIVVGREKKNRIKYINESATKQKIHPVDIKLIEKEEDSKNTQSIGIESIKKVKETVYFKPVQSEQKLLIIEDAHLLTTEAQNALLKLLEEPPANTLIYLGTDSAETLLPTIRSRCTVITLEEKQKALSAKDLEEITTFIHNLETMTIGDKLKYAEQYGKDKQKALKWLTKLITALREKVLEHVENNTDPRQARMTRGLRSFQTLHTTLKTTNTNPRFAIEHTLLHL